MPLVIRCSSLTKLCELAARLHISPVKVHASLHSALKFCLSMSKVPQPTFVPGRTAKPGELLFWPLSLVSPALPAHARSFLSAMGWGFRASFATPKRQEPSVSCCCRAIVKKSRRRFCGTRSPVSRSVRRCSLVCLWNQPLSSFGGWRSCANMAAMKARICVRMSKPHYGGNLVDGATMLSLFGDVATELCIRADGDEGLFRAYDSVEFLAPVYSGDFIEAVGEVVSFGKTSLKIKFAAWYISPLSGPGFEPSAAKLHSEPILVCKASGTCGCRKTAVACRFWTNTLADRGRVS